MLTPQQLDDLEALLKRVSDAIVLRERAGEDASFLRRVEQGIIAEMYPVPMEVHS